MTKLTYQNLPSSGWRALGRGGQQQRDRRRAGWRGDRGRARGGGDDRGWAGWRRRPRCGVGAGERNR